MVLQLIRLTRPVALLGLAALLATAPALAGESPLVTAVKRQNQNGGQNAQRRASVSKTGHVNTLRALNLSISAACGDGLSGVA